MFYIFLMDFRSTVLTTETHLFLLSKSSNHSVCIVNNKMFAVED